MRCLAILAVLVPFAVVPSARAQAQSWPAWGADSPDGDASVLVLDGLKARRMAGGFEVASQPMFSSSLGPCGGLTSALQTAGIAPENHTVNAVVFTPDATRIVVAGIASNDLVVFDAATRAVVATIALSGSPADVAVSSDNVHAVTANIWQDTASIVDLVAGTELAVVPVGAQPQCVRFTPGGMVAVVGNAVDQSLSVIDVAAASELHRIAGAGFASTTTLSFEPGQITTKLNGFECPSDTLAVHPDNLNDQIDFFDLAAGTVSSVACNAQPRGIAMTPDGSKVVVSHYSNVRRISVIDTATHTISNVITTTVDLDEPIAIKPDGTKAAVAIQNATIVVDLSTGAASAALSTASVNRMVATADGNYALAIGFNGSLISWATQSIVKNLNLIVSADMGAASPSGQRAVMVASHFGTNMLVQNTNGAAGFIEANVPNGPPPEADATRKVAVSADGTRAVATNVLSDTASVIDLTTGNVLAVVAVGDRPAGVAIRPDTSKAVVANLDSTFASVIDLSSFAVTNVPISTRGSEVAISPDGHYAYVAVVASGDGVWRIDLTTNTVAGAKLATGDMGSTGFLFNQASGIELSHDGATLAVCGSFTDVLTLVDTASWSVVANVPVGDFPVEAEFAPNDAKLYVSNRNPGTVSEVSNAGGASAVTRTFNVGAQPFELAAAPAGDKLYVENFQDENVGVVTLASGLMTATVPLPDPPQGFVLSPTGSCLYVASGNWSLSFGPGPLLAIGQSGSVSVIDTSGPSVAQTLTTNIPPAALAFDASGQVGLIASPFGADDGLTRLDVPSVVSSYCTSKTNSDGCAPPIAWTGTPSASAGSGFTISATLIKPHVNGIFFYSTAGAASIPFQGGYLCMLGPRKRTPIQNSGGSLPCEGAFAIDFNVRIASGIDPNLVAGASFWGQFWSRDGLSPSTTNLTNAITGQIEP